LKKWLWSFGACDDSAKFTPKLKVRNAIKAGGAVVILFVARILVDWRRA